MLLQLTLDNVRKLLAGVLLMSGESIDLQGPPREFWTGQ